MERQTLAFVDLYRPPHHYGSREHAKRGSSHWETCWHAHPLAHSGRLVGPHRLWALDISNRAIRITDRAVLIQQRIESPRLETYLEFQKCKVLTAIRTVFGLALRIVQFEIAANWWRFESLQTTNCDSRHLSYVLLRKPTKKTRLACHQPKRARPNSSDTRAHAQTVPGHVQPTICLSVFLFSVLWGENT